MSNPNLKECRPCRTEKLSTHWKRFSKGKAVRGRKLGMPKLKPPVAVVLGPGPLGRWISLSRGDGEGGAGMGVGGGKLGMPKLKPPVAVVLGPGPLGRWISLSRANWKRASLMSVGRMTEVRRKYKLSVRTQIRRAHVLTPFTL